LTISLFWQALQAVPDTQEDEQPTEYHTESLFLLCMHQSPSFLDPWLVLFPTRETFLQVRHRKSTVAVAAVQEWQLYPSLGTFEAQNLSSIRSFCIGFPIHQTSTSISMPDSNPLQPLSTLLNPSSSTLPADHALLASCTPPLFLLCESGFGTTPSFRYQFLGDN
jgi:hypothetical protein